MKALPTASPGSDRLSCGEPRLGLRFLATAAIVTAVLGFSLLCRAPSAASAGDQDAGRQKPAVSSSASHPEFVARFERTLAGFDRRLIVLANLVLEDAGAVQQARKQVVDLMIRAKNAEAAYLNAKLAREVAEIAVVEYRAGIAVQDQQVVEGEISLAKSNVERARRNTAEAKERLARITALTDNSALGLNLDYLYTDRLSSAELLEKQATLTLEQAESKKKVLMEYTIPKRTKELQSEVAKARSDELARQATWELSKAMPEAARRESREKDLPADRKRILALIDEAIPLEDKIRAKLLEVSQVEALPESKAEEIGRLMHDLAALVDRAESERDAGDFSRLKPRIQQAARQFGEAASK